MGDSNKIYFPNLNVLRFIAALMVIIHHTDFIKTWFNVSSNWNVPSISIIGKLGVILFFVLSGFLITYLLLAEEKVFQSISIKSFYIRRILRIWPLYFLIIGTALFVIPYIDFFQLPGYGVNSLSNTSIFFILLYVTFFPNFGLAFFGNTSYAAHTWSIGTEEQFYLIWPILIRFVKRNRELLMIGIIVIYQLIAFLLQSNVCNGISFKMQLIVFWSSFNIDCMAIGGLFALLLFKKSRFLTWILNKYLFYGILIIFILLILNGISFRLFHYQIYAIIFGLIIINFAAGNHKISLENPVLHYLGKISYGLYMYHPVCIVFSLKLLYYFNIYNPWIMYFVSIAITILIAGFSYQFFEKYFIGIKSRFSKIVSSDRA